jgi:hypothetical protein
MGAAAKRVPASVWGGFVVALLSWQVAFQTPGAGLDPSWNAGLAMAAYEGLHFGKEVVFTYGPLGFLNSRIVFFGDLAALSFVYGAALYVLFCIGLVWALRRALPLLLAAAVAYVAVAWLPLPLIEVGLMVAVLGAFWLLEGGRTERQLWTFTVAAATFAAPAALIKLSTGPLIPVVLLIALAGARVGRGRIAVYIGLLLVEMLVLWVAAGQSLGDVPAFVGHTLEITSGYSSAMLRSTDVATWKVTAAVIAAIGSGLALVAAAWFWGGRDQATRRAGTAIAALVSFAIYKEGVVRVDAGHLTVLFANAVILWIAVGLGGRHRAAMLGAAAIVFAISLPVRPAGVSTNFDPVTNVRGAVENARTLVDSGRRDRLIESGHVAMQSAYGLAPAGLAAVGDRSVAIEPWEIGAAWAYELDWDPMPVFQNYNAYTSALDRLNAAAAEDPDGPERILRHNPLVVQPEFTTADVDNRFLGWDPPEQARAVFCNFAPLWEDERWQVLGRVGDRCAAEREIGSASAPAGEPVKVPAPRAGEAVFVRIHGAGVSGLEKVQTFLFHAASRHAVVNGTTRYRLVPETAADGLLLRAAPEVASPGPFDPFPEARTIAVEGGADRITYDFYALRVAMPR